MLNLTTNSCVTVVGSGCTRCNASVKASATTRLSIMFSRSLVNVVKTSATNRQAKQVSGISIGVDELYNRVGNTAASTCIVDFIRHRLDSFRVRYEKDNHRSSKPVLVSTEMDRAASSLRGNAGGTLRTFPWLFENVPIGQLSSQHPATVLSVLSSPHP